MELKLNSVQAFFILDEILLAERVMSRYEQVTQAKPETSR